MHRLNCVPTFPVVYGVRQLAAALWELTSKADNGSLLPSTGWRSKLRQTKAQTSLRTRAPESAHDRRGESPLQVDALRPVSTPFISNPRPKFAHLPAWERIPRTFIRNPSYDLPSRKKQLPVGCGRSGHSWRHLNGEDQAQTACPKRSNSNTSAYGASIPSSRAVCRLMLRIRSSKPWCRVFRLR